MKKCTYRLLYTTLAHQTAAPGCRSTADKRRCRERVGFWTPALHLPTRRILPVDRFTRVEFPFACAWAERTRTPCTSPAGTPTSGRRFCAAAPPGLPRLARACHCTTPPSATCARLPPSGLAAQRRAAPRLPCPPRHSNTRTCTPQAPASAAAAAPYRWHCAFLFLPTRRLLFLPPLAPPDVAVAGDVRFVCATTTRRDRRLPHRRAARITWHPAAPLRWRRLQPAYKNHLAAHTLSIAHLLA